MLKVRFVSVCLILGCLLQAGLAQDDGRGDSDLVLWWQLDEMSGDMASDASGHRAAGYLRGNPKWIEGVEGGALELDGRNDYIAVGGIYYGLADNADVTVCTWIRTTREEDQIIFSFDRSEYWRLEINGPVAEAGRIGWDLMTDAGLVNLAGRTRVDDGQWHHVAALYDRGRIAIYIDGQIDATARGGSTFGTGNPRFGFVGVGSEAETFDGDKAPESYFAGALDDVRLYTRALSADEIQELAFVAAKYNDHCQDALPVGEVTALEFDTTEATHDGPGQVMRSPNIWYVYTPTCTGPATISLCGSQFDTMLAVYSGADCDPSADRLLAYNDDFCNFQSELTLDVMAGESYLIEVGGYGRNTGQGVMTIICEPGIEPEFDLGDAPDSAGERDGFMTAYASGDQDPVEAHFPTTFADAAGRAAGPVHLAPLAVAHLGEAVTLEEEAATGVDEDSNNNIEPANDKSDQDGGDDGVIFPIVMPQGGWASFDYLVNVVTPGTDLWVNVWCDFNRDGDWDDSSETDPEMGEEGMLVSEWAVRNQLLFDLPAGLNQISVPAFMAWHPTKGPEAIWMRITLSEKPWRGGENPGLTGNAGSGPAEGYEIGETEDYKFVPEQGDCTLCKDLNGDGEINFDDLIELMYDWIDSCSQ